MSGDVEELFRELRSKAEMRRKRSRVLLWVSGSLIGLALIAWITIFVRTGKGTPDISTMLPMIVFATIFAMAHTKKHKSLVADLAARKDPRILGDLLEAAYSNEPEVQKLAVEALPDILGVWLSGECTELDPTHRGLLYRLLDTQRPVETVEAVLIAVRALGGIEAVPYLESLRRRTEKHKLTRWQRLSAKSLETLADVRLREARRIIDAGPIRDDVEALEQRA